jgi:hypothetical protein
MALKEIGYEGIDWVLLAQDNDYWQGIVNTVMNHQVPPNSRNFLTSQRPIRFSRRTLLHAVD